MTTKKKMTPEEVNQLMKDIGQGKAQEILQTCTMNGTKEQVENQLRSVEEMAIYILAWRAFNASIHVERFSQGVLVQIQDFNDRIQDEVEVLRKQEENGELEYHVPEEGNVQQ